MPLYHLKNFDDHLFCGKNIKYTKGRKPAALEDYAQSNCTKHTWASFLKSAPWTCSMSVHKIRCHHGADGEGKMGQFIKQCGLTKRTRSLIYPLDSSCLEKLCSANTFECLMLDSSFIHFLSSVNYMQWVICKGKGFVVHSGAWCWFLFGSGEHLMASKCRRQHMAW